MKKFRQAKCPYCGKKVGLFRSWTIKTQGEYECPKCGAYSNIEMDPATYLFAVLAVILSGLIYLVYMLIQKSVGVLTVCLIISPYFIFYILSAFLVRLRKPVMRKKQQAGQKPPARPGSQNVDVRIKENSDIEHTIIAESLKGF